MFELHLGNETGGLNNGVVQLWVDGVLQLDFHDIDFKGSDGFTSFTLPSNHQFTTVNGAALDMYEDIDDLAIRTTGPIGPLASVPDSNPPTRPSNLRILP
jgi:hypothetical protein